MQVSVLVAMLAVLTLSEGVTSSEAGPLPEWMGRLVGVKSLGLTVGVTVILWSLFRWASQRLGARLSQAQHLGRETLRLPGRIDLLMRLVVLVTFAGTLTVGGWAHTVLEHWRLGRYVLIDEWVLLLPFVAMTVVRWACFYPVNRTVREYVVAGQLAEGLSARPVWTRREYLSFQVRSGLLLMLVPLSVIVAWKDVVQLLQRQWFMETAWGEWASELGVGFGTLVVFVVAPALLRRIWLTRSLPAGPLRERLEGFCQRLRLKHRDILLWDTFGGVANAAVMGVVGQLRYVLLSDALIENMSDEQIEAVFGHEAGHVKHHHILFLVLSALACGMLVVVASEWVAIGLAWLWPEDSPLNMYGQWILGGTFVVLVGMWAGVFGCISRRFERQADVHAAQAVAAHGGGSREGSQAGSVTGSRLDVHGAQVMAAALVRVALLNGIPPEARSWRHSSIASRARFLRELATSETALARFSWRLRVLKVAIFLTFAVGAAGAVWTFAVAASQG